MNRLRPLLLLTAGAALAFGGGSTLAAPGATPRVVTERDALALALEHSPSLAAAAIELRRARLAVEGQDARYRPSLSANLGYTRSRNPGLNQRGVSIGDGHGVAMGVGIHQTMPWGTLLGAQLDLSGDVRNFVAPNVPDPIAIGPGYGVSLRLYASQPLLRGFGREFGEADLRAARVGRTAAELAQERTASEAARDVVSAFWELWYAQAAVAIQRQSLEVAERQLDEARMRVEVGALAPLEVLPLETEVAQVREALVATEADVRRRQVALARLVGTPLAGRLEAAPEAPGLPGVIPDDGALVGLVVDHAYELDELAAAVEQARIQAQVTEELARPRLDASTWFTVAGLGNRNVGDTFSMFGQFQAVSLFVGLELELPLDRTLVESDVARGRLSVDAARERLRDANDRVTAAAVDAAEAVRAARSRLALSETTAGLAARSAEGQRARFEAGAITATDWIIAEQQRRQAELRVARASADLVVADVALQHLTGALLDRVVD